MKVLIAVLSVRTPPYGQMIDTSKATWDSIEIPGVETIYYVGSPDTPLEDRVLGTPVQEAYKTIGHKNLHAWKWMLENRDFDFLARPNASCYVHKARLHEHCKSLPSENYLAGSIVVDDSRPSWIWGGHQFLMSRDVVQNLVENPQVWNHAEIEDVALSHAATALGIGFTPGYHACAIDKLEEGWRVISTNGQNFEFTDWADVAKLREQHFFRVKQDLRRHEDAVVMNELFKNLIP